MPEMNFALSGVVKDKDSISDFEGPLSLILMLLSKNKIAIQDIRVADILDQYLASISELGLDLDSASDFVRMAAHLLYIKTKTILADDDEEVSELEILKESLIRLQNKDAYQAICEVVPQLKAASEYGIQYYVKNPEPLPAESREYRYTHQPSELLEALSGIYSRLNKTVDTESIRSAMPRKPVYSVREKSRELLGRVRQGKLSLGSIYSECRSKSELVATFVSVLELCSMGSIRALRENDDYCLEFCGGNIEEILEKIEE